MTARDKIAKACAEAGFSNVEIFLGAEDTGKPGAPGPGIMGVKSKRGGADFEMSLVTDDPAVFASHVLRACLASTEAIEN